MTPAMRVIGDQWFCSKPVGASLLAMTVCLIVPTLCVGMPQWTLRVRFGRDAERPGLHSHAERGNDQSGQPLAPASSIFSGLTHASNSSSVRYPNCNAASRKVSPSAYAFLAISADLS